MFGELGAAIIDADEATHAVYQPGTPGFREVVETFGDEYVREDGQIDRAKLGDLVFKNPEERKKLNAIVHPRVRDWMAERTADAVERGADVVMQDVPLLFENGLQGLYSSTVLVYADPATQLARLTEERGLSSERARAMLASQMPIEEKRALADYVIDNAGTRDETRRQVEEIWTKVRSL
jgi:dephospho-CoA kinase